MRRVHAIYRSLGYPWAVARLLTGLSSTCTAPAVFLELPAPQRHDWLTQKRFATPHLPQGAPTSPSLANLAAWGLDCRLAGLADRFEVSYTRYADDLAFSGDAEFARPDGGFMAAVETILAAEGYAPNHRKTRIMRRNVCQTVTGIVVNDHCNVRRAAFDALKAALHNAVRRGPDAENHAGVADFRAHLDGRVAWVETVNLRRGEKLRRLFDEINWG